MHTQPHVQLIGEPPTELSKNGSVWVLVLPFVLEPCPRYENLGDT